jgi:hypothetical protein
VSDAPSDPVRSAKAFQDAIRNVLLERWDPIGVAGVPQARDEYDAYIHEIQAMLRRREPRDRLADHLEWIETKAMQLAGSHSRRLRTVHALVEVAERFAPESSRSVDPPDQNRDLAQAAPAPGMPPSMNVAFVIAGRDIDPDDVTRTVGLEPSRLWHATNKTVLNDPRMSTVNWIVERCKVTFYEVDEAVRQVLDIVWPHREGILRYQLGSKASASLMCSVTIREDRPVYALSAETMSRLATLRCEFSLDIYDYSR